MKKSYLLFSGNQTLLCTTDLYNKIKKHIQFANIREEGGVYWIKRQCENQKNIVIFNGKEIQKQEGCQMCVNRLREQIKKDCELTFEPIEKDKNLDYYINNNEKHWESNLSYLIPIIEKEYGGKKNEELYKCYYDDYDDLYEEHIPVHMLLLILSLVIPLLMINTSIEFVVKIKKKIKKLNLFRYSNRNK